MGLPYCDVIWYGAVPSVYLTNVQNLNFTKGRVKVSDDLRAGTATVNGRRPDLLPSIEIGDPVNIVLTDPDTSGYATGNYRVADLTINYGIVSSLDTWTLELEDALAYLGRATTTRTWSAGASTGTVAGLVCGDVGISLNALTSSVSTMSGQTVTNAPVLDVFQTIYNTEQALIGVNGADINWWGRGWQSNITYKTFADDGTGVKYDAIAFGSLADNYADKVVVYPRGSTEVVTGSGIFNYNLDSYSLNSGEATNLGLYVKGIFDVQTSTPLTISCLLNTTTTSAALDALTPGRGLKIIFRGNTYYTLVQGYTVTSDVDATRITYNLSSTASYAYLTLDEAVLGRLDYNKLGY